MFISYSTYDVMDAPVEQTFKKCGKFGATAIVVQRDSGFLFIPLSKKFAEVRCVETGKKISKRQWNDSTRQTVKNLLNQHSVPKTGWYIITLLIIGLLSMLSYELYSGYRSQMDSKALFTNQSMEKQNALLHELKEGDLLKSDKFVYAIHSIEADMIWVYRSSIQPTYKEVLSKIDTDKYTPSSFTKDSLMEINSRSFWQLKQINTNLQQDYNGQELIYQINIR